MTQSQATGVILEKIIGMLGYSLNDCAEDLGLNPEMLQQWINSGVDAEYYKEIKGEFRQWVFECQADLQSGNSVSSKKLKTELKTELKRLEDALEKAEPPVYELFDTYRAAHKMSKSEFIRQSKIKDATLDRWQRNNQIDSECIGTIISVLNLDKEEGEALRIANDRVKKLRIGATHSTQMATSTTDPKLVRKATQHFQSSSSNKSA